MILFVENWWSYLACNQVNNHTFNIICHQASFEIILQENTFYIYKIILHTSKVFISGLLPAATQNYKNDLEAEYFIVL
jgi:hypothetical protein